VRWPALALGELSHAAAESLSRRKSVQKIRPVSAGPRSAARPGTGPTGGP